MKCLRCGKQMRLREAPRGWRDHQCQSCRFMISHKGGDTLIMIRTYPEEEHWELLQGGWLMVGQRRAP